MVKEEKSVEDEKREERRREREREGRTGINEGRKGEKVKEDVSWWSSCRCSLVVSAGGQREPPGPRLVHFIHRGRSGVHCAINHVILQTGRPADPAVKLLPVVK